MRSKVLCRWHLRTVPGPFADFQRCLMRIRTLLFAFCASICVILLAGMGFECIRGCDFISPTNSGLNLHKRTCTLWNTRLDREFQRRRERNAAKSEKKALLKSQRKSKVRLTLLLCWYLLVMMSRRPLRRIRSTLNPHQLSMSMNLARQWILICLGHALQHLTLCYHHPRRHHHLRHLTSN